MKKLLLATGILALSPLLVSISEPPPAQAAAPQPIIECTDLKVGLDQVRIRCTAAGIVLLNTVVDLPTVTLPPVTLPPVTLPPVTLPPRPRATVTVPGATITLPGSETTVPGQTETIRVPGPTITVKPSELPTARPTATVTATETVTGQVGSEDATVDPNVSDPVVDNTDDETVVENVTEISLTVLAVLLAGFGCLYAGYILGYKDKQRKDAKFMSALRDQLFGKKTER